MPFPPSINPQLFSIAAVAVGAVLVENYSANELNAIGNWLQLVGQYVETSAAQLALIQARATSCINSNTSHKQSGKEESGETQEHIDLILEMIYHMKSEIEKLQKENDLQ